jgi:hypothetical protein
MLDLNEDYKKASSLITATKTFNEIQTDIDKLGRKVGSSLEKDKKSVISQYNKLKDKKKSFERNIDDTFKKLLDLTKIVGGDGESSQKYLKDLFITSIAEIEPLLEQLLLEESQNALGCSQQQTFAAQTVWIPVKSIDLMGMLKIDETTKTGQVLYEPNPITPGQFPFSFNKELKNRINKVGQSYQTEYKSPYNGTSGQALFDIEFTNSGQHGESGDFFKVSLKNRAFNANTVSSFFTDYYSTIQKTTVSNIYAHVMNLITGMIHMDVNSGKTFILDLKKFEVILQRILGLCNDFNSEIDISGVAKVSELDGVDETFFQLTDVDLRKIEQEITNIKTKVMQFEDCDNVILPVPYNSILDSIIKINPLSGANQNNQVKSLTDFTLQWKIPQISLKIDDDFIQKLIQGLVFSALSPKVLLPIMVMAKSLQQTAQDAIDSFDTFAKIFKKFLFKIVKKIGAKFIQILFEKIKKDITKLLRKLLTKINAEKAEMYASMILTLVQLLSNIANLIDFQKCKSVIDGILSLFDKVLKGSKIPGQNRVPLPLLLASQLLDGYSPTRAFTEVIGEMQNLGLPTGPLPDGSPNLGLAHTYAIIKGMSNEQVKNGRTDVPIPPLTVPTPLGPLFTIPQQTSGKWI